MKDTKGITLIALVITIIVLLILAGVSIAMLSGDNGILSNSKKAKVSQIEGQVDEEIKLAVNAVKMYSEQKAVETAAGWLASEHISDADTGIVAQMTATDLTSTKGYTVTAGTGAVTIKYTTNDYKSAVNNVNPVMNYTVTITGNTFTVTKGANTDS